MDWMAGILKCPECGRFMKYVVESNRVRYNMPEDAPDDIFWLCSCGNIVDIRVI